MTEWPAVPLEELCDRSRGITYGIVKVGDFVPGGVPVIRGGDIRDNKIVFDDEKRVTREVSDGFSRTILRGGELVINLIAEPGHTAIVPPEMAGFNVSRDVAVVPLGDSVTHGYVNWYLKSPAAVEWLTARLSGSVTQKINLGVLREIPVPLPERSYQDRIAAVLGALDDKIAINGRIAGTAKRLMQAKYLQAINKESTIRQLGGVVEFHNRKRVPLSSRQRAEIPGPYPYYGAAGVAGRIRDFIFSGPHLLVGEDGSVITAERKPVTQYVWGDFWVNNHAHVLTGKEISTELLAVALQFTDVAALVTGAVQPKLNMRNLMRLEVPLPAGRQIATLDKEIREAMALICRRSDESQTLATLRDALLPQLMSGKLRVREAEKIVGDAV